MIIISPPLSATAISSCNAPCKTEYSCSDPLMCINSKCNDDPEAGTHVCYGIETRSPPSSEGCDPYGTLVCNGKSYPRYPFSPPVTSSTKAKLTLHEFSEKGVGGAPLKCDQQCYRKSDPVVALSTGWYVVGSRCGKMIRINANGRSVLAKVVNECDSRNGCDREHGGRPPCRNDIVGGSDALWDALGLNKDDGVVNVTWSLA